MFTVYLHARFIFYLLVLSNASLMAWKPSVLSSQALTSEAWQAEGSLTTGPLVMLSARIRLLAPPPSFSMQGVGSQVRYHVYYHIMLLSQFQSTTKDSEIKETPLNEKYMISHLSVCPSFPKSDAVLIQLSIWTTPLWSLSALSPVPLVSVLWELTHKKSLSGKRHLSNLKNLTNQFDSIAIIFLRVQFKNSIFSF